MLQSNVFDQQKRTHYNELPIFVVTVNRPDQMQSLFSFHCLIGMLVSSQRIYPFKLEHASCRNNPYTISNTVGLWPIAWRYNRLGVRCEEASSCVVPLDSTRWWIKNWGVHSPYNWIQSEQSTRVGNVFQSRRTHSECSPDIWRADNLIQTYCWS